MSHDPNCIFCKISAGQIASRKVYEDDELVVFMDIHLPGMDGVECVRHLSEILPGTQIVMLTVHDNPDAIFNSLAAGASGYLLKPVRAAQLIAA